MGLEVVTCPGHTHVDYENACPHSEYNSPCSLIRAKLGRINEQRREDAAASVTCGPGTSDCPGGCKPYVVPAPGAITDPTDCGGCKLTETTDHMGMKKCTTSGQGNTVTVTVRCECKEHRAATAPGDL
jgi:hypothetical protein